MADAIWLIQYQTQGEQPNGEGCIINPYSTWLPCYMYYNIPRVGHMCIA